MTLTPKHTGWIEVICGPMFSGKTEELIRRLVRAQIAKQRVAIFKPSTDKRFAEDYIVSHNKRKIKSIQVIHWIKIFMLLGQRNWLPSIPCPIPWMILSKNWRMIIPFFSKAMCLLRMLSTAGLSINMK